MGLLFVCIVVSTVMPIMAYAANREGQFSVSPVIGGITFDGEQHLETTPFFGIRGGYNFTDHIGVEALFDYASTRFTRQEGNHVDFFRYGGEALYHFMPEKTFVPYVAVGYSGVNLEGRGPGGLNVMRGVFDYGAGMKYFVSDDIAIRADVRHLVYTHEDVRHNLEYSVGLYIPFGGVKPLPKPVAQPVPQAAPEEVKEAPLEPVPAAEPTPGKYKYCITLRIDFDIDKAAIRPEYHNEVAKVGDFMKKYPSTSAVIEGHTDNVGTYEHNMELSMRRAESVVNYLVDKFGIERSRLSAKGYGYSRPLANNATNEGKQQNRRIEAIIDCAFDVKEAKPPETLCMLLQVEFDTGKANIKPQYNDEIAKVADYMKKYPTTTALIEGHTDNVGGYEYNMKLSQKRAESVVNYLVEKFGIERARLTAKGYGPTRRIAYNSTAEGRQKNRRITAVLDCVIKK
jgi:OOP family OmpA-OmpF porin